MADIPKLSSNFLCVSFPSIESTYYYYYRSAHKDIVYEERNGGEPVGSERDLCSRIVKDRRVEGLKGQSPGRKEGRKGQFAILKKSDKDERSE